MKSKDQKKAGIILSYLSQLIKILSNLLYTPLMLRILGQAEYGLYQLVYSIIAYLGLLNLGFGSSYVRFYTRMKAKEDKKAVDELNGLFIIIFSIIAFICIFAGLIMTNNIESIFSDGLTAGEYAKAKVLMILMTISLSITFLSSVFDSIITANEKFIFQKTMILLKNILNPFVMLPFLLLGYGAIGMTIVSLCITIVSFLINVYYCIFKLDTRFCFVNLKLSLFKEMWSFTIFIFINQIIDQINWNVDKFLLGRFWGTIETAIYSVASNINVMFISISSTISYVFIPKINNIVSENLNTDSNGDRELNSILSRVGRIQFFIIIYIYIGFIFFGRSFIRMWAGNGYSKSYIIALLLMTPIVPALAQTVGIEVRQAKNKHQLASLIMAITALLNLLISIPLSKYYGSVGAAFGTFLCLLINLIIIDIYYVKLIKLDIISHYKDLGMIVIKLFIPILFGLCGLFFDSFLAGIVWIFLYTSLYFYFLFKFVLNDYEKRTVNGMLRKLRGNKL